MLHRQRRFPASVPAATGPTRRSSVTPLTGTPCVNVGRFEDGTVEAEAKQGQRLHLSLQRAPTSRADGLMFYATWSKGFRPGGINRQPGLAPYNPDFLINYELGWKTTFGPVRWNGAIYHQRWQKFQFSFLGENSLTVVQNGRDANINGVETDINYVERRPVVDRGGGLHRTPRPRGTSATSRRIQRADCSTFFPELGADGTQDVITAPSGTRLPVTPKFKITGTARYTWDMGPGRLMPKSGSCTRALLRSALRTEDQAIAGDAPCLHDRGPVRRL